MRRIGAGCFFLMVSLSAFSPGAGAGEPLTLTLDEAVTRALDQNLDLKKSLIDLSTAEYASGQLWAELFPTISAGLGADYSTGLFTGSGFELDRKNGSYSASLGISLNLSAGIPHTMKMIRLAWQTELLNYEDARRRLEIETTKNFYSLLADGENIHFLEESLELARRQFDNNQIAFNNGLMGEMSLLQSRLEVETARFNLSAGRAAYANRMGEFLALLGLEHDRETVLAGKLSVARVDADPDKLIRENLPGRPDIVNLKRTVERLRYTEKRNRLESRAPSIRLETQWGGAGENAEEFADSLRGAISLSIPLDSWIPGTKTARSLRSDGAELEKAELDLKNAGIAAVSQIRSLTANLRNSWESIEIARLRVSVAERTYTLTEEGFRNGTVESMVLADARNNLADARQRLLMSELSYQTMMLDLSAAVNADWKEFFKSPEVDTQGPGQG
ncbi:MAG: TolC family protein [Treponema sp.]|jgi:multidrug efflux system outer membrane protein|nr:TolC family protein [Treponema sp.]